MAVFMKDLTGKETARFGFRATDLGYVSRTNHGYTIALFGDTFDDTPDLVSVPQNWRSPVGLRQSNTDIENGIRWDNAIGGDIARQMIPYRHAGTPRAGRLPDGFTNIPNDVIHLPDGRFLMTTAAVRSWDPAITDGSWSTFHSRMWTSTDTHAETWERTWDIEGGHVDMDFPNSGEWRHFQNNSMLMLPDEPWVYIHGTDEGRRPDGGVHLMRVHWQSMWNRSTYEFWGRDHGGAWAWRRGGHSTPILMPTLPRGAIGELSTQFVDGRLVLSYCDGALGAVTRIAVRPEGEWTVPRIQMTPVGAPSLYAPCIHPFSTMGRAQMLLSQWTKHPKKENRTTFYGVRQWEVDLSCDTSLDTGSLSPDALAGVLSDHADPDVDRAYVEEVVRATRWGSSPR